jgi:hypothetical protein
VAAGGAAGEADVADDAADPPARHEHAPAFAEAAVEFVEERLVGLDARRVGPVPELAGRILVRLQQAVRRACDDQVEALVGEPRQIARVAVGDEVRGRPPDGRAAARDEVEHGLRRRGVHRTSVPSVPDAARVVCRTRLPGNPAAVSI